MALEREVLDSSTSVVLVGWCFREDSIADNTAPTAPWSTIAWTCSGGRLEMGVVGVVLGGGFTVVFLLEGLLGKSTVLWVQQRCVLTVGQGLILE